MKNKELRDKLDNILNEFSPEGKTLNEKLTNLLRIWRSEGIIELNEEFREDEFTFILGSFNLQKPLSLPSETMPNIINTVDLRGICREAIKDSEIYIGTEAHLPMLFGALKISLGKYLSLSQTQETKEDYKGEFHSAKKRIQELEAQVKELQGRLFTKEEMFECYKQSVLDYISYIDSGEKNYYSKQPFEKFINSLKK